MAKNQLSGKLAVILHADIAGSTGLVRRNESIAHERIQDVFRRFSARISTYRGRVLELRGDALLAEFERSSDAVAASLAFQEEQAKFNAELDDDIRPGLRIGIAMGEVVIADNTMTGEGVVLAQRLEQLAEPGGITIQGSASETIPGRFPFEYRPIGEQRLKGFSQPVRAFSVALRKDAEIPEPGGIAPRSKRQGIAVAGAIAACVTLALLWLQPWHGMDQSAKDAGAVFGGRPSLVVLPFDNLSDDAEQAYLAHGITEDITTDLSRIGGLFVISSNTAFSYLDKSVDPQQVSRDLGVSYLLEGSVRRVGNLLRINVQLIDGENGGHIWAERYDGDSDQILVFQDRVLESIVAALSLQLDPKRQASIAQTETSNPEAYEAFLRGWTHYRVFTPENFREAARHFKRAIELDPDYSRAHAALASTYWEGWERWWYEPMGFDDWIGPRRAAEQFLEIAMQNPTALAHQVASEVRRQQGRLDDMLAEALIAVEMEPNNPDTYKALVWAQALGGQPSDALVSADRAISLDPQFPAFYLYQKGFAYFVMKQYETAADHLERALALNPANFSARNILIPTYAYLGRPEAVSEQLELHPLPLSIDWIGYYWRFKHIEDWEHLRDGLRLAGVPDVATLLPRPPQD